jgi:hypothetical protein
MQFIEGQTLAAVIHELRQRAQPPTCRCQAGPWETTPAASAPILATTTRRMGRSCAPVSPTHPPRITMTIRQSRVTT